MALVTVSSLSEGEKLLIDRRRVGHSQAENAKKYKVSIHIYRRWEKDRLKVDVPLPKIGRLTKREQCHIMRRRRKRSLEEVAQELGCCRWWVCQMEKGEVPINRLYSYWQKQAA